MSPSDTHMGAIQERLADVEARLGAAVVNQVCAREGLLELEKMLREHQVLLRAGLPLLTQLEITRQLNKVLIALGVRGPRGASAQLRPLPKPLETPTLPDDGGAA